MSKPINTYNDFQNYKVNLEKFNNINTGGCNSCQKNLKKGGETKVMDMNTFINKFLPKLKGGYKNYKLKRYGGENSFNIFKDLLTPNTNASYTNTNITGDLTTKGFNFPDNQIMSRTLF